MSSVEVHKQITADEIAHTFEDEVPKSADLSQYAPEDWLALAIFWIMVLFALTYYVVEKPPLQMRKRYSTFSTGASGGGDKQFSALPIPVASGSDA